MTFLLDTNVVSEPMRPRPDARVIHWLNETDEDRTHLCVGTIAELRYGAERLSAGRRRQALGTWLTSDVLARFADRILPVDRIVAKEWGRVTARRSLSGRPITPMDALIAATALVHGLTLVTRNVRDFADTGVALLDPWAGVS